MITRLLCMTLIVATVSACGGDGIYRKNNPVFDGERFRGSVKSERRNRQDFVVTINQVSKSRAGAAQAALYKATQHCIQYFGTSDITWQVPPDADPESLPVSNDTLTLRGSCGDL